MRVVLKNRRGEVIKVLEGSPSQVAWEFAKCIGAMKERRDCIPP